MPPPKPITSCPEAPVDILESVTVGPYLEHNLVFRHKAFSTTETTSVGHSVVIPLAHITNCRNTAPYGSIKMVLNAFSLGEEGHGQIFGVGQVSSRITVVVAAKAQYRIIVGQSDATSDFEMGESPHAVLFCSDVAPHESTVAIVAVNGCGTRRCQPFLETNQTEHRSRT